MVFELQFIGFPSFFLVQFICWRNQFINLKSFHHVWVSEDHLQFQWFTGRTHSIYQIVGLMAVIYYSKSIQSDVRKGTRRRGPSQQETWHKPLRSLFLEESHRMYLISSGTSCDNTCEMFKKEADWRLGAQGFYWRLVT